MAKAEEKTSKVVTSADLKITTQNIAQKLLPKVAITETEEIIMEEIVIIKVATIDIITIIEAAITVVQIAIKKKTVLNLEKMKEEVEAQDLDQDPEVKIDTETTKDLVQEMKM